MPEITINGKKLTVPEGTTVLEAARSAGIDIPSLCYLKDVNDLGSCRLCMVEAEGIDRPLPACRTKAAEGMVIETETPKLTGYRKTMLKLILSNHRVSCLSCPENGECRLQDLCRRYGVEESGIAGSRIAIEEHPSPFPIARLPATDIVGWPVHIGGIKLENRIVDEVVDVDLRTQVIILLRLRQVSGFKPIVQ